MIDVFLARRIAKDLERAKELGLEGHFRGEWTCPVCGCDWLTVSDGHVFSTSSGWHYRDPKVQDLLRLRETLKLDKVGV